MATSSNLAHGECSSVAVVRRRVLQPQAQNEESLSITPHDIFLSHSGAQKGFAKGLYTMLTPLYSTFFDITHHSLPLAENFPTHIFYAARRCRLAMVVLSEQYVTSKWPMLELFAFVKAMPPVRILPLFYNLSPTDIKSTDNLVRWRERWKTFAAQDTRIDDSMWLYALRKICSNNGLVFDPSEGEAAFLEKIESWICENVPPTIQCNNSGIFGKDRLCEVIVKKLKEMASHGQYSEHGDHSLPGSRPKPLVLGIYGLPGSGKSTLSRFLHQHFFPRYGGKALYLEFPTDPSLTDLINIFKELLKLTDFRQRINLGKVSHIDMVYNLLKTHCLQKLRVFLVMDNVNDKSVEAVEKFLELGVGPGSKVILVARTLDVLQPALLLGKEGQHFISGSVCVPCINEAEAARILLHTTRAGMGVDESTFSRSRINLMAVVRMCGFGSGQDKLMYLPLVMKTMGSLLRKYNGLDVKKCGNVLSRFRNNMKTYKEGAVQELIKTSFEELGDEQLQLLFLDVTLFILPLKLGSVEETCYLLGILHACSPASMETKIKELQRHCFLRITDADEITVHDVYIEFAESIQGGPYSRLSGSARRWCWMHYKHTGAEMGRELVLVQEHTTSDDQQVRTMIVEVGGGCERVELKGFAGLKALVVRNCESLAVLALAGVTSLVSIDIQNCPCMVQLESTDCDYSKVKRLSVQVKAEKKRSSVLQVPHSRFSIVGLQRMIAAISVRTRLSSPPRCFEGIATRMRGLQVLKLKHTGIKRLVDMSSCWPQLRDLYVKEYHLEAFEVGSLQRLNRFRFVDRKLTWRTLLKSDDEPEPDEDKLVLCDDGEDLYIAKCKNKRRKLNGMDLMKECPELEEVCIESAFFEKRHVSTVTPKVRSLEIQMHFALNLPDLTLSAPSLEKLKVKLCTKLKRIDFFVKFERLTILTLLRCSSLVEVTGLGFLPNLHSLRVVACSKLQILGGFNDSELLQISNLSSLTSLKLLIVKDCPQLQEIPSLMGLTSLEDLKLSDCPKITVSANKFMFPFHKDSQKQGGRSLRNVQDSDELTVTISNFQLGTAGTFDAGTESSQELNLSASQSNHHHDGSTSNAELRELHELIAIQSSDDHGGTTLVQLQLPSLSSLIGGALCSLGSIRNLQLGYVWDLVTLDGIEHLSKLQQLCLNGLPELRNVKGLESLINLRYLSLRYCPQLEELPPLHGLVKLLHLQFENCGKLRAVKDCDEMIGLRSVRLVGCTSLECFVFRDLDTFLRRTSQTTPASRFFHLTIQGCKFASIEAMVEWALDTKVPVPLRIASRRSLEWEFKQNNHKLRVVEAFFPMLVSKALVNEDDCFHYQAFFPGYSVHRLSVEQQITHKESIATVGKLWSILKSVPKMALLQQFESDIEFRLSILNILESCPHIAFIFMVGNWLSTRGI